MRMRKSPVRNHLNLATSTSNFDVDERESARQTYSRIRRCMWCLSILERRLGQSSENCHVVYPPILSQLRWQFGRWGPPFLRWTCFCRYRGEALEIAGIDRRSATALAGLEEGTDYCACQYPGCIVSVNDSYLASTYAKTRTYAVKSADAAEDPPKETLSPFRPRWTSPADPFLPIFNLSFVHPKTLYLLDHDNITRLIVEAYALAIGIVRSSLSFCIIFTHPQPIVHPSPQFNPHYSCLPSPRPSILTPAQLPVQPSSFVNHSQQASLGIPSFFFFRLHRHRQSDESVFNSSLPSGSCTTFYCYFRPEFSILSLSLLPFPSEAASSFLPSIEQAKRNHMSSNHAATRRRRDT
ncbi:uncharacterized protein CLUP02_05681 [Colletotrichum lupini]|uniref:Uncharacterized protein n=1 Tax=Colletotrichum lupini TaxID=145971 RepID=A0A9Q8WE93_9PEZI|nr:uncharacterized protein CLUP02_05681 [Colletotrichum lupini]UQC80199.1 hypothetical protein CLUP02_05681 [Colletotrichum lupini]